MLNFEIKITVLYYYSFSIYFLNLYFIDLVYHIKMSHSIENITVMVLELNNTIIMCLYSIISIKVLNLYTFHYQNFTIYFAF